MAGGSGRGTRAMGLMGRRKHEIGERRTTHARGVPKNLAGVGNGEFTNSVLSLIIARFGSVEFRHSYSMPI